MARSTALVSSSMRPSSRKRISPSQWFRPMTRIAWAVQLLAGKGFSAAPRTRLSSAVAGRLRMRLQALAVTCPPSSSAGCAGVELADEQRLLRRGSGAGAFDLHEARPVRPAKGQRDGLRAVGLAPQDGSAFSGITVGAVARLHGVIAEQLQHMHHAAA